MLAVGACLGSCAVTVLSCSVLMMRPPVRISGYRGDGTIAHLKNPVNPGFKIDFAPFSLDKPQVVRYRLDGVPKPRWHVPYTAAVVVDLTEEEDRLWPRLPEWLTSGSLGVIGLRMEDSEGRLLFSGESSVSGLSWSRLMDDMPTGDMRAGPQRSGWEVSSARAMREQQPWILRVDYEPGRDSPSRMVRIRVMAGGVE